MTKKELVVKFVVVDSMQNKCYDDTGNEIAAPKPGEYLYGQDAQFQGHVPSAYTDNQDGTVTDLNTGLMWQKTPENERVFYENAADFCNRLRTGGYDDWRLPTLKEFYSLMDFRGEIVLPFDPKAVPGSPPKNVSTELCIPYLDTKVFDFQYPEPIFSGNYWSSDEYDVGPLTNLEQKCVFGANFADGHVKAYSTNYHGITGEAMDDKRGCFIRAVRGEERIYGVNKFVDNADGTITDQATGLMWQKEDDGDTRNWGEALKYAENLELAGFEDWRLPSAKELCSIVEYSKKDIPAIDVNFFTLSDPDSWFWTNTTQGDFKFSAVYFCFGKAYGKLPTDPDAEYMDWHGSGAQRSDPKNAQPGDYRMASPNGEDLLRLKNYSRCVRIVK